jgi:hypothetical protein
MRVFVKKKPCVACCSRSDRFGNSEISSVESLHQGLGTYSVESRGKTKRREDQNGERTWDGRAGAKWLLLTVVGSYNAVKGNGRNYVRRA